MGRGCFQDAVWFVLIPFSCTPLVILFLYRDLDHIYLENIRKICITSHPAANVPLPGPLFPFTEASVLHPRYRVQICTVRIPLRWVGRVLFASDSFYG